MPKIFTLLCGYLVVYLLSSCAFSDAPLSRSEADVQLWLLDKTPVGSKRADVHALFIQNRWSIHEDSGSTPLSGTLGIYETTQHVLTSVVAIYEFDQKDRLTDIKVEKLVLVPNY